MRRDYINVAILWFVFTLIAEILIPGWNIFPLKSAQEAEYSDHSFVILLKLSAPVFVFVVTVLAYSLFKFRASSDNSLEPGNQITGNTWFSGVWLFITLALNIIVVIHPGLTGLASFQGNRGNPDLVVEANGVQWRWQITYPAQGVKIIGGDDIDAPDAPAMVLPVNKRIHFKVSANDSTESGQTPGNVLHSFWIPAFRDKIDAVPGSPTDMYITPNEIASYSPIGENFNLRVQCAELCGTNHSTMAMPVKIVSQEDFDAWIKAQVAATANASGDPVAKGAALYNSATCSNCHTIDGSKRIGPTWKGLFGKEETLADNETVTVDEAYIHESIVTPSAKIVKGYPDMMTKTFGKDLSEENIANLIAYIKSLK